MKDVKEVKEVEVMTPAGIRVSMPVNASRGICSASRRAVITSSMSPAA